MKKLKNIHPGEVLQEEFLVPMNITAYRLSKDTHISQTRISEILKGNRRITADTALRFSIFFGNSAKFWLGLQMDYDIEEMKKLAAEKGLVTQMGIQVHSFYDYKLATLLIQSGIIGKVHTVHAWSPKNWGYDGPLPEGEDPVPEQLDWNLWLGTSKKRPYKKITPHFVNAGL